MSSRTLLVVLAVSFFAVVVLASAQSNPPLRPAPDSTSKHLAKLRAVKAADVLGLTERQVLQRLQLDRLQDGEGGTRWFSSGRVGSLSTSGYLRERHHLLTFVGGKVSHYETADVITACVIVQ